MKLTAAEAKAAGLPNTAGEQDRAECDRWWRETSLEDKLAVLAAIARRYDDPVMEVMSRFAQLAFNDAAERHSLNVDGPT